MNNKHLLEIAPEPGYSPHLGVLVSTLKRCRERTIKLVQGLRMAQLDYLFDAQDNSIGALLLHVASLDVAFQEITFRNRNSMDVPELVAKWQVPMYLDEPARQQIRGNPVSYYLDEMATVRESTLSQFRQYSDDWLWQTSPESDDLDVSHYYWWYHVYEDEINHRGEMAWKLSRMPSSI